VILENNQVYKMKLIGVLAFITTLCVASFTNPNQNNSSNRSNLRYLKNLKGKYPSEAALISKGKLKDRIKLLLNHRFEFLQSKWNVENPIELKGTNCILWACQQHNCSNTNFIIVINLDKNVVYAGVREEESITLYSEDSSSNLEVIKWANRN
jgi:hypothetical protein